MTWESKFVARLADIDLDNVFNPYSDRCPVHDLPNASSIRRANLAAVLAQRKAGRVDRIWFGRDLGYRGGRRTGLALTDEATMLSSASACPGAAAMVKATNGSVVAERTAAVIWSVVRRLNSIPFLWNAFPLHPHVAGEALSNRAHTVRERRETAWAIEALIRRFEEPQLIAIGNDASKALTDLGFAHETVRHPSYGGQREFIAKMEGLYGLSPCTPSVSSPRLL